MKKFAALLLALCLCFSLALAESADLTGTWYLTEVISGEMSFNPSSIGLDMTITLNADGTAACDVVGQSTAGAWSADGSTVTVTIEDDPMVFTLVDGTLVAAADETTTMVFGREPVEAVTIELGEARTDVALEDFNGVWTATVMDMLGMQFSVADMGLSMVITITDGVATIVEGEGEEATSVTCAGVLENGVLTITPEDETEGLPLTLHESGLLAYTFESDGMATGIYFERTVEAE